MNDGSAAAPDDDPLGPVVESFLARFRRGERPALTDLIARHPDLAGPIRELIPALVELEQLGGSTGGVIPPSRHPTGARALGEDVPSPERLGDYLILRPIGGGGMGVVYEAEHEPLKSRVALKVMHPRFRADPKFLRRFHAEARLAAGLHHTNIVSVFDYGEQDGVCYYAMQYIHGQPLDNVLADIHRLRDEGTQAHGPPGRDAIRTLAATAPSLAMSGAVKGLFTGRFAAAPTTAAAVPSTVAVTTQGQDRSGPTEVVAAEPAPDRPPGGDSSTSALGSSSLGGSGELRYFREIARVGAQVADALEYAHRRGVLHRDIKPSNLLLDALGNVWVTDFGLAKLEKGDDLTQSHELVGTLRYMAPERFRGTSDRRGDLYSLGATLYELLTLHPPFEESDQIRLIERIRDDAPPPPRQLDGNIPRDLETIVLKALAKDAKDRFASAGELADELRRYVEGRPIRSRPVSAAERFWRWCKRDPWLAGASIAATLLTIVLAVGSSGAAWVFRGQVERIRRAEADTRKNLFESLVAQARGTRLSRRPGQRFESLKALREAAAVGGKLGLPQKDLDRVRDEAIACLALPDLEPTGQVFPRRPGGIITTAFDRALTRYALRFRDGTISVRGVADDREIARFRAVGDRDAFILEFSPDGRYLATDDVPSRAVRVWDVDRRALVVTDPGPAWWQAPFRPDSRRILVGHGKLNEYDLPTGQFIRTWPGQLVRAAFRPDGARIAAIDNDTRPQTCRIFEADSGRPVRAFSLRAGADYLAWSPDGRTLAIVCDDVKIDLWDAETGIRRATLEGHTEAGVTASFHPAGTLLASNGWESRLRLWEPILGLPLLSLAGGSSQVGQNGRIVVWRDDRLIPYRVEPALEYRTFARAVHERMYARPSIRHDGRILAVGADRGAVLWDLADGTELAFLPIGLAWSVMFDPSGDLITSGDAGVQRWPIRLDSGRGALRIGPPRRLPLPASYGGIDQDRTGRIVAVAAHDFAYVATPGRTFRVGPLDDCRHVAVSPDGRWLATGSHVGSHAPQVWRIADGQKEVELPIDEGTHVAFTPDGNWLVAGSPRLGFWEVGTWREAGTWRDERSPTGVGGCFCADGRLIAVVEPSKVLRLVDFPTGRTLARLESPDLCGVYSIAFSPDGSRLVFTTKDRPAPCVHVWDLRAIRRDLSGMGLDWEAPAYPEDTAAGPRAPLTAAVDMGAFRGRTEETSPLLRQERDLQQAGKVGEAIDGLRRATARFPDLAEAHNDLAWLLATAPAPHRDRDEAVEHARRAVALAPGEAMYLNTHGVALYRAARFAEAIPILRKSLEAGQGQLDAFDLFFLAMAHHRLGHRAEARDAFDRAVGWLRQQEGLIPEYARELAAFRAEAEAVLAGPAGELPEDVFAPAR